MNETKQRVAIALHLGAKWYLFESGWTWLSFKDLSHSKQWKLVSALNDPEKIVISETVDDYPNDLNAMADAEKTLSAPQMADYANNLNKTTPLGSWMICATARERSKAFLMTLGLWKDTSEPPIVEP